MSISYYQHLCLNEGWVIVHHRFSLGLIHLGALSFRVTALQRRRQGWQSWNIKATLKTLIHKMTRKRVHWFSAEWLDTFFCQDTKVCLVLDQKTPCATLGYTVKCWNPHWLVFRTGYYCPDSSMSGFQLMTKIRMPNCLNPDANWDKHLFKG